MGNRADNNDGSCREILTGRLKGKWRVQYRQENGLGQKTRLSRVFPTKTDAKQFLQDLRRGSRIASVRQQRELTLCEWFEWLAENDWPEAIAEVTIAYRRGRFRKYIEKELGGVPLTKFDPLQVRAFYRRLRDRGVCDSLLQEIRGDLVRVFNQAIIPYQRVPSTLANPFRLELQRPPPREAVALSPVEVRTCLAIPSLDLSNRAFLATLLLGGLRLGEIMALAREQLRFDENLIVIDRAVRVSYGGKQWVGKPKRGKARCAVMCPSLKAVLMEYCIGLSEDAYLWSARRENKPRTKKVTYAAWNRILEITNLPGDMSPHDCRLTHINLIEKLMPSVSTTTLKEHVGHAATGVTEANYTRPITAAQVILRDELDRVLGP